MALQPTAATQRELLIVRDFDAPRELVFRMWTEPKHLAQWWGPRDYPASVINADVRPGGKYRHCLQSGAGDLSLWLKGEFREIVPPERLVFTFSWEEEGERGLETLVTITFADQAGKTRMTFRQTPFQSDRERDGHSIGWSSSFDRLDEQLAAAAISEESYMSLTLHYHPLSSYCHKVLIALYENGTPFTPHLVNLQDAASRAALLKVWPIGKFPVLHDDARDRTIPESSIIIEYLDRHYRGTTRFIPDDADLALQVRERDRFYDLYIHHPMQTIVGDRLRPSDKRDLLGVEQAKARMRTAFDIVDQELATRTWAVGERFTLADCAASPALFYADWVQSFGGTHKNLAAYFERLKARPSFARAIEEAKPYFHMFPKE